MEVDDAQVSTPPPEPAPNPKANMLMPKRTAGAARLDGGRGRKRPQEQPPPPKPDAPPEVSGPAATLKSVFSSLDPSLLQQLAKSSEKPPSPPPPEEPVEDPKLSIIKNPPMELRKLLRKLRIDKDDLKTLLDIPLAIISDQNVLALIQQRNGDTDHVDHKEPVMGFLRKNIFSIF